MSQSNTSAAAGASSAKPRLQALCLQSLKRTYEMFLANEGAAMMDTQGQHDKIAAKILTEYAHVKDMPQPQHQIKPKLKASAPSEEEQPTKKQRTEDGHGKDTIMEEIDDNTIQSIAESVDLRASQQAGNSSSSQSIVEYNRQAGIIERFAPPGRTEQSSAIMKYKKRKKPVWHAPWKLKTVISGHTGWVRCVSVEPGNEWFCTGAADRTIKLWDLASGTLKVTLTGHIGTVRGLIVSPRHSYLFSCGEDRMVKCWDLEQNKVIRHYHGHLNGIYSCALHPKLDVLLTGGRDSCCRVWDIRTKGEIHVLGGHSNLVSSVIAQGVDPQVITGSADATIKLWDLGQGKCMSTLTNHKKSVRAMLLHPTEFTFVSASADNIKKWKLPNGDFISNMSWPRGPNNEIQRHTAIVNTVCLNQEQVMMSGADNGTMQFWDFQSGYPFQSLTTTVQPGSLESEAGIFASSFDMSGSRLITCEADKTVKIWWEDQDATPETHPIDSLWRPTKEKF